MKTDVDANAIMSDLRQRVRDRLRGELLQQGASGAFEDPQLFAEVDALLRRAAEVGDADALILPEVLGDPASWQLQTAIHYQSHRGGGQASFIIFVKQRILMPLFRWLFEYSRDNFERQRRVNQVLFACVQELAAETARLRQQVQQQSTSPAASATTDRLRT